MDLISNFLVRDIELIPEGEFLRVRGQLTDQDRELIKTNKQKILAALNQNSCLGCRAAGYWDFGQYAGKLLCFHYAVYECKPGRPVPCEVAKNECLLLKETGAK